MALLATPEKSVEELSVESVRIVTAGTRTTLTIADDGLTTFKRGL